MNERSKSKYGREYSLALDHISKDTSHLNKLQNMYFIAFTTFGNRLFFPQSILKRSNIWTGIFWHTFTTHYVFVVQEKQENELFSLLLFLMYPAMSRSLTTQTCQSSLWNPLSVLGTRLPVPIPSGREFRTDPSAAFRLTHCCPHLQTPLTAHKQKQIISATRQTNAEQSSVKHLNVTNLAGSHWVPTIFRSR